MFNKLDNNWYGHEGQENIIQSIQNKIKQKNFWVML